MTLCTRVKPVSRHIGQFVLGLLLTAPLIGLTQTGLSPAPSSPDTPASAAPASARPARPVPRVTSPTDARRSLDLNNPQPEGKVTPQLSIPLGKKGDAPVFQRQRPNPVAPAGNSVNDGAARCGAMVDVQARAKCRDELAHEAPR